MLELPDWCLASWFWFGYGNWSLIYLIFNFCLSLFLRCKDHPCPSSSHLGLFRMLEVTDWGLVSWPWCGYGLCSLILPYSDFLTSILILKVQRTSCPSSRHLGLWRMLGVPDWILHPWSWFRYGHWYLIYHWPKLWLSFLILKVQRTSMSSKYSFGALEDAGGSWLGFGILIWIWKLSLVFDIPMIQILALYIDFEGAKNIHVL